MNEKQYGCLHPVSFGIASGLLWAVFLFTLSMVDDFIPAYGSEFIRVMSSVYVGFSGTMVGGIIGAIWGFFDAFIGCLIFAWIYNMFCRAFSK